MKKLSKTAMRVGLGVMLVMASGVSSALVLEDFVVNPSSTGNNTKISFTADKMVGGYVEQYTGTPTSLTTGTFSTSGYWNVGQFYKNEGTTVIASGISGLQRDYDMYSVFKLTGNYVISGSTTNFIVTGGFVDAYIDRAGDTTFASGATGFVLPTVTDASLDDYKIISGTNATGLGSITVGGIGTPNGNFDIMFNPMALTVGGIPGCTTCDGDKFFTSPRPFYMTMDTKGQFNNFDPALNQTVNGSLDAFFIPEPSGIALLGLGLASLSLNLRRRKQV